MNKKLIAVAVAGACALPFAAQADSSNVTIYGVLNASYDSISANDATDSDRLSRISSNQSRIGFKGTEDLGNGMSALWQIEQKVDVDSGSAANMSSRNAFVGLSGKSWGTFLLGTHDTPYKMATGKLDLFVDTMGDYNSIIGAVSGTTASSKRDLRLGNVAAYISPTFSGFHAAIATSMMNENGNGGDSNPSAWSLAGIYENGPLFASLGYEKQASGGATNVDTKGTKLGVGYTMDAFKVGFVYERLTDSTAGGSVGTRNAYGLSGSYTMGANVIKAAYLKASDGDNVGATDSDTAAKNFTIGVDHNMSKRTAVYALYTKTTNAAGASYNIGGNGAGGAYTPTAAGEDPSAWSFGIKHSF